MFFNFVFLVSKTGLFVADACDWLCMIFDVAVACQKCLQMPSEITNKHYITLKRCRRQKQLAEEFVINLPYHRAKDQRERADRIAKDDSTLPQTAALVDFSTTKKRTRHLRNE